MCYDDSSSFWLVFYVVIERCSNVCMFAHSSMFQTSSIKNHAHTQHTFTCECKISTDIDLFLINLHSCRAAKESNCGSMPRLFMCILQRMLRRCIERRIHRWMDALCAESATSIVVWHNHNTRIRLRTYTYMWRRRRFHQPTLFIFRRIYIVQTKWLVGRFNNIAF